MGVACSFKEEIEQMRSKMQPWQVAKLLIEIERVKDHDDLRVDSIFDIPKEEPLDEPEPKWLKRRKSNEAFEG